MNELELVEFIEREYTGSYPVFSSQRQRLASILNILSDATDLADDFSSQLDLEDVDPDFNYHLAFEIYFTEHCSVSFTEAHLKDWHSLFPYNTAPGCRFEVPYGIKQQDGTTIVFEDMPEWVAYLDNHIQEASNYQTFEEFARDGLGVQLLLD